MLKYFLLTKVRANVQAVIISLLILSAITGRLIYIGYVGDNDVEGNFFDFGWLSVFLYNLGVEISLLSFGALMWISTNFHPKKSKSKRLFHFISIAMMLLAFFFLSWIFTDKPYWSNQIEIVFAILICIPTTVLFVTFVMFISREITNIEEFRNMVIDFFVELRNIHILGLLKNANKLELLDDYTIERKTRLEVKARLKLEKKK